jgi:NADH-quinone oxidoreductase subunit C
MDDALKDMADHLARALEHEIVSSCVRYGELTIEARADQIVKVLAFLRDDGECQFRQLLDVTAVDYPERTRRFDVVYHLLSMTHNHRIRVTVQTDEKTPIPSVTGVHRGAEWFEREAWDMYGVMFTGHPDLRRILTDYGFEGFPLRKDFPLTGYVEVRYSEKEKRVIYEPVSLRQDFRNFDFMSPWEGAQHILPDAGEESEDESAN